MKTHLEYFKEKLLNIPKIKRNSNIIDLLSYEMNNWKPQVIYFPINVLALELLEQYFPVALCYN